MKTKPSRNAVLMTGQLRTYQSTAQSIVKHMVLPNHADLFYFGPEVTEKTFEDSIYGQKLDVGQQEPSPLKPDVYGGSLTKYFQHQVNQDFFKEQAESCVDRSEWIAGINPQRIFSFFYNIQNGVKMVIQHERDNKLKYGNIIITRPDVAVYTEIIADCQSNEYQISEGFGFDSSLYLQRGAAIVFTYKNALTGELIPPGQRLNDHIIILHRDQWHLLATIYDTLIEQLLRKFPAHSETLLWHALSGVGELHQVQKKWVYEIFGDDSKPIISFRDTVPHKSKQNFIKNNAEGKSVDGVSIIFQGSVAHFHDYTVFTDFIDCIAFLREHNPDVEIIVSTYKGSFIENFEYMVDKVVLSDDPGSSPPLKNDNKISNVNRLIVSSQNGIKYASKDIVVKTRTDSLFYMKEIAKFYNGLDHTATDKKHSYYKKKIVASPFFTIDPSSSEKLLFHISDWIQIGIREDLKKYWDMPHYTVSDSYYYNRHPHKKGSTKQEKLFVSRYATEQYLTIQGMKNFGCEIPLEYHNHKTPALEQQFWDILFNNYIVLDHGTLGLVLLKYASMMKFLLVKALIMDQQTYANYQRQYLATRTCKPTIYMRWFRVSLVIGNRWERFYKKLLKN